MTAWAPWAFLLAIGLYYGCLVRVLDKPVLNLLLRSGWFSGRSVGEAAAAVNIVVAGCFQLLTCGVLAWWIGPAQIAGIWWGQSHVAHWLLVPLLALGQLAAASLLCALLMQVARIGSRAGRKAYANWQPMMDSGWLRSFLVFGRGASPLPRLLVVLTYIGSEELLFRAIAPSAFASLGVVGAGVISWALFVAVQFVGMPSVWHALFPASGAFVLGAAHTYLAVRGVPVAALALCHLLFFLAAAHAGTLLQRQAGQARYSRANQTGGLR